MKILDLNLTHTHISEQGPASSIIASMMKTKILLKRVMTTMTMTVMMMMMTNTKMKTNSHMTKNSNPRATKTTEVKGRRMPKSESFLIPQSFLMAGLWSQSMLRQSARHWFSLGDTP